MALVVRFDSEHDVAKIVTALVDAGEAARAADDPTAERLYLKLADQIHDAAPTEEWSERLGLACERWRESALERARIAAARAT